MRSNLGGFVIVDPVVRIDVPDDHTRLLAEVERLPPRLVVLDTFVRLHRINEAILGAGPRRRFDRQRLAARAVARAAKEEAP